METSIQMKKSLIERFVTVDNPKSVDFCREVYKFLTEGQTADTPVPIVFNGTMPDNGIYLVYDDGSYCKFEKSCKKEGIKYVGIVHDGHPLSVALKDLGSYQLLRDDAKCKDESGFYLPRECDALNDWECEKRTKRIQDLGTDIPLEDGEFIPPLPMLSAMCYWAGRGLNEALEFAGGQPLDMDSYYWSCTEHSSYTAWYMNFRTGGIFNNVKNYSFVVRPVAAFTFNL